MSHQAEDLVPALRAMELGPNIAPSRDFAASHRQVISNDALRLIGGLLASQGYRASLASLSAVSKAQHLDLNPTLYRRFTLSSRNASDFLAALIKSLPEVRPTAQSRRAYKNALAKLSKDSSAVEASRVATPIVELAGYVEELVIDAVPSTAVCRALRALIALEQPQDSWRAFSKLRRVVFIAAFTATLHDWDVIRPHDWGLICRGLSHFASPEHICFQISTESLSLDMQSRIQFCIANIAQGLSDGSRETSRPVQAVSIHGVGFSLLPPILGVKTVDIHLSVASLAGVSCSCHGPNPEIFFGMRNQALTALVDSLVQEQTATRAIPLYRFHRILHPAIIDFFNTLVPDVMLYAPSYDPEEAVEVTFRSLWLGTQFTSFVADSFGDFMWAPEYKSCHAVIEQVSSDRVQFCAEPSVGSRCAHCDHEL